jgi:hypothetical protein
LFDTLFVAGIFPRFIVGRQTEIYQAFKKHRMFQTANHVISAASITIFAASVTGRQLMQSIPILPVGSMADYNVKVVSNAIIVPDQH